jgi:hypothetical protein
MSATSSAAISAGRALMFGAIVETANLAASYSRNVAGAAWRRDALTVGGHLRQLRLTTIAALKTYIGLAAEDAKPRVA